MTLQREALGYEKELGKQLTKAKLPLKLVIGKYEFVECLEDFVRLLSIVSTMLYDLFYTVKYS